MYYPIDNEVSNRMLTKNLNGFNAFWTKLGKETIVSYEQLREALKSNTLTKIELCCLVCGAENYDITVPGTSIYDFVDRASY